MSPTHNPPDAPSPEEPTAADFVQRGRVLIIRREYVEAVKVCRAGLLSRPTFVEGRLVLAMALMAQDHFDEVLSEMRIVLDLEPDNAMAHQLRGEAFHHKGAFREARRSLTRALSLDPHNEKADLLLREIDAEHGSGSRPGAPRAGEADRRGGAGAALHGAETGELDDEEWEDHPALGEPRAWGEEESDLLERGLADPGLKAEGHEEDRYSTAPWLPPTYLQQMRRGAAEEQDLALAPSSRMEDEATISEDSPPQDWSRFSMGRSEAQDPSAMARPTTDDRGRGEAPRISEDEASLDSLRAEMGAGAWSRGRGGAGDREADGLGLLPVADGDDGPDEQTHAQPEDWQEVLGALEADPQRPGLAEAELRQALGDPIPEDRAPASVGRVRGATDSDGKMAWAHAGPGAESDGDREGRVALSLTPGGARPEEGTGEEEALADEDQAWEIGPGDTVMVQAPAGVQGNGDEGPTMAGVDQELLLNSLERAVSSGPRVAHSLEDESSLAMVDKSLLSEWGRVESGDRSGDVDDGEDWSEDDRGEPTVAVDMEAVEGGAWLRDGEPIPGAARDDAGQERPSASEEPTQAADDLVARPVELPDEDEADDDPWSDADEGGAPLEAEAAGAGAWAASGGAESASQEEPTVGWDEPVGEARGSRGGPASERVDARRVRDGSVEGRSWADEEATLSVPAGGVVLGGGLGSLGLSAATVPLVTGDGEDRAEEEPTVAREDAPARTPDRRNAAQSPASWGSVEEEPTVTADDASDEASDEEETASLSSEGRSSRADPEAAAARGPWPDASHDLPWDEAGAGAARSDGQAPGPAAPGRPGSSWTDAPDLGEASAPMEHSLSTPFVALAGGPLPRASAPSPRDLAHAMGEAAPEADEEPESDEVEYLSDDEVEEELEPMQALASSELSEVSVEIDLAQTGMPPLPADAGAEDADLDMQGWEPRDDSAVRIDLGEDYIEEETQAYDEEASSDGGRVGQSGRSDDEPGYRSSLHDRTPEPEEPPPRQIEEYEEATRVKVEIPQPIISSYDPDSGAEALFEESSLPGGIEGGFPEEQSHTDAYLPPSEPFRSGAGDPYDEYPEEPTMGRVQVPAAEPEPPFDELAPSYDEGPAGPYAPTQPGPSPNVRRQAASPVPRAEALEDDPGGDEAWEPRVERTADLNEQDLVPVDRRSAPPGARSPSPHPGPGQPVHDARRGRSSAPAGTADLRKPFNPPTEAQAPEGRKKLKPPPDSTGTSFFTLIRGKPGSRRPLFLVVGVVCVILAAVLIGRVVRHLRIGDQIEERRAEAEALIDAGNIIDYMAAAQSYAEILKYRPEDTQALYAQSRVQAAIPFEFGDPSPQASHPTDETGAASMDRLAMDIYAAIYSGSMKRAKEVVDRALKAFPQGAAAHYLAGRLELLEGKAAGAEADLKRAHKLRPRDTMTLRWLAESQAQQGKYREALATFEQALKQNPDHVASLLGRAALMLSVKEGMKQPLPELQSLLSGERASRASRGQQGWANLLLARLYGARGDLVRTRAFLAKAKANKPTRDPFFLDLLAQVLIETYQVAEAERVVSEARELLDGRPHPFFRMAQIYLLKGQPKQALVSLKKAVGLQFPAATLLRASILSRLGRQDEALKEVENVLDLSSDLLEAHLLQAEILAAQGKGAEAEQTLLGMLPRHPRNTALLTSLGAIYLQLGKTHQARQRFNEALRLDRYTFEARLKLAEVDRADGQYMEAYRRLEEAARLNPGNSVAQQEMAELEFELGSFDKAKRSFQTLVERSPSEPELRLGLAQVLIAQHEYVLAEAAIRAAESSGQAVAREVALRRGQLHLAEGKAQLAVSHLTAAAGQGGDDAEAYGLLVRAHLMNNDMDSAQRAVDELARRFPGSPDALLAAGLLDHGAGNFGRASKNLVQALQVLRTSPRPPLRRAEMLVLLGRAYQDGGRSAEALAQYEEAARACPTCAEPHYRIGLVHFEGERNPQALTSLRRAVELDAKMMEVYYDLGQVYEALGQTQEAITAYKTYLSYNPPRELADAARAALETLEQPQ